ncbi:10317_t:CDS:2 [Paraglomus brasilianum]|uniref:10317_t:CDS:1 n=1 Tax=Paraglomus brasilianum TaxID=144538 RepID=A0A9N9CN62_9GLOM|nr:10317_t:CDS:2 [Paraglomus brasilianum]
MASKSKIIFLLVTIFCLISQVLAGADLVAYCDYIPSGSQTPTGRITFSRMTDQSVVITGQANTGFKPDSKWTDYNWYIFNAGTPWKWYQFQPQFTVANGGTSAFQQTVWNLKLADFTDVQSYINIWGPSFSFVAPKNRTNPITTVNHTSPRTLTLAPSLFGTNDGAGFVPVTTVRTVDVLGVTSIVGGGVVPAPADDGVVVGVSGLGCAFDGPESVVAGVTSVGVFLGGAGVGGLSVAGVGELSGVAGVGGLLGIVEVEGLSGVVGVGGLLVVEGLSGAAEGLSVAAGAGLSVAGVVELSVTEVVEADTNAGAVDDGVVDDVDDGTNTRLDDELIRLSKESLLLFTSTCNAILMCIDESVSYLHMPLMQTWGRQR